MVQIGNICPFGTFHLCKKQRREFPKIYKQVEDVSRELLELLWHFIAGLFPASIKCVASSKGKTHKGKSVFHIQWDSPIKSNTSSFFCVHNYTCMLWLSPEEQKNTQQTKTQHCHIILPCPLGLTLTPPKILHAHQEREKRKPKSVFKNAKAVCNPDLVTRSVQSNCLCL